MASPPASGASFPFDGAAHLHYGAAMIWTPHVTVAAVAERDGRFLLVEELSNGATVVNQPAGHLEDGESLLAAVIRETLEETAWHFEPDALLGIYRWRNARNGVTYIRFAFTGKLLAHEPARPLDRGITQTLWLTADEICAARARHRSPQVQRCLDDYLAGRRFPLSCLLDTHS